MLRHFLLSKSVLALVGLLPVLFGEIALLHGNAGPEPAGPVEFRSPEADLALPGLSEADCIVYEAASGRLVTVKAPAHGRASDCARL